MITALLDDIKFCRNLGLICQTYEELSVISMRQMRDQILAAREFYLGLSGVYHEVKKSYQGQVEKHEKQKKKKRQEEEDQGRNKVVSLLLSPNSKLYGDIINKTFSYFAEKVSFENTDVIVVGRQGQEAWHEMERLKGKKGGTFKFFPFPQSRDMEAFAPILEAILPYEQINIYHGFFKSLVRQRPNLFNITGDIPLTEEQAVEKRKFLFEPDINKVLDYFNSNLKRVLFRQTVFENHLAQLAGRATAMEESVSRINQQTKILENELKKQKMSQVEKEQQLRVAAYLK